MRRNLDEYNLRRLNGLREVIMYAQYRAPITELKVTGGPIKDDSTGEAIEFANGDLLVVIVSVSGPLSEVTPDIDVAVDYYAASLKPRDTSNA